MIIRVDESGEYFAYFGDDEPPGIEVREGPEVPPEVWQTQPADGDRCMAAVRAMCS